MWSDNTRAVCQAIAQASADKCRAGRRRATQAEAVVSPWSMLAKRGRGTIRLAPIEYRILKLLASRPNQIFTPGRIVETVNTQLLTAATLRRYISSLRGQLG